MFQHVSLSPLCIADSSLHNLGGNYTLSLFCCLDVFICFPPLQKMRKSAFVHVTDAHENPITTENIITTNSLSESLPD